MYNIIWSSYIIDLEKVWQIIAPPTICYSDHFLYASIILRASPRVRYPEFGGCPLFGCCNCIIIYGDISWYIEQCVHYSVDVCYWECPLIESRLYCDENPAEIL